MNIKKIIAIVLVIGLMGMAAFAYYVYNNIFTPNTAFNNVEAHVYIPTGATFNDVTTELSPILKNMNSFQKVANRKGYSTNIKAGHYIIKNGMNNNEIVNTLRSNNRPIKIKFNNQERLENLAGQLAGQIEADSITILKQMRDSTFLSQSNFNTDSALAMYIPNTYELYWNTSAANFRDRMLAEYNRFWNETRTQKARSLGLTPVQVISLAAIVQKETAKIEERPRVAGVYMNRIERGMPLQADPTVIYAKKLIENDFDQLIKRVLYKDLELESPYNTYKYIGIPPGPITMPDISSIDAVLNYEKHNYLYFVADVSNFGYHKFAKSLVQHNRNKADYVRWVNSQGLNR